MNDLTFFQKAMVLFWACIIFFFGYYFLVSLPNHNNKIAALAEKEVLLKEQDQLHGQQLESEKLVKDQQLEKEKNCLERWESVKQEYWNVFSVYYNEIYEECYVKYYDKSNGNEISEAPIDDFWPITAITVSQLELAIPKLYGGIKHEEVVSAVNSIPVESVRSDVIANLLAWNIKGAQIAVWMWVGADIRAKDKADGLLGPFTLEYFTNPNYFGESALKTAQDLTPLWGIQTVLHWANFREFPSTDAAIIQVIDPSNSVMVLGTRVVDNELWYNIRFYDKTGRITARAFGQ